MIIGQISLKFKNILWHQNHLIMRLFVLGKTVRYSVEIVTIICQQLAIFSPILALLDKITHVIINMDLHNYHPCSFI